MPCAQKSDTDDKQDGHCGNIDPFGNKIYAAVKSIPWTEFGINLNFMQADHHHAENIVHVRDGCVRFPF